MKVKIITHYADDDIDMDGDYCSIEVFVDGVMTRAYGDSSRDRGEEKANAFVEGLKFMVDHQRNVECVCNEVKVLREQISDYPV